MMNKRKVFALALSVCLIAVLVVGGSLAYLADTDSADNVFTVGNVKIDLWENFNEVDEFGNGMEELRPVTYDENGKIRPDNMVEKDVYVDNIGSEDAYVRVHIAIPEILNEGREDMDAKYSVLHVTAEAESLVNGHWNWNTEPSANDSFTVENAKFVDTENVENAAWNRYEQEIDGIRYNVFVVTHENVLKGKRGDTMDTTCDAISKVYLNRWVTNEDVAKIKEVLGKHWRIPVIAEAAQAAGFDDAYEALNTSFGIPGTYDAFDGVKSSGKDSNP